MSPDPLRSWRWRMSDVGADALSNIYPPGGGASVTSRNGCSAERKLLAAVFKRRPSVNVGSVTTRINSGRLHSRNKTAFTAAAAELRAHPWPRRSRTEVCTRMCTGNPYTRTHTDTVNPLHSLGDDSQFCCCAAATDSNTWPYCARLLYFLQSL